MTKYTNAPAGAPVFSLGNTVGVTCAGGRRGIVCVGGGGSARSGIVNSVQVLSVEHNQRGEPVPRKEAVFETGERLFTSGEASADGKLIACSVSGGCSLLVFETEKGTLSEVAAWETDTVVDKDTPSSQNVAKFSPVDSSILATGGDDSIVTLWKVGQRKESPKQAQQQDVAGSEEKGVELKKSSEPIVKEESSDQKNEAGDEEPAPVAEQASHAQETEGKAADKLADKVFPWEAEIKLQLKGHSKAIKDIAFSPSGSLLATASGDNSCRIWDSATGRLVQLLPSDTAAGMTFRRCEFVSEERLMTLQAKPGRGGFSFLVEFILEQGKWRVFRSQLVFKGLATTMTVFSPFICVGDARGGVTLLDQANLEALRYFQDVHNLPITGISSAPNDSKSDERYIVTGSMDKTITMIPAVAPRFRPASVIRVAVPVILVILVILLRLLLFSEGTDDGDSLRNEL